MPNYTPEQAAQNLREIGVILRAWHSNRSSDSVNVQQLRQNEFASGERLIDELIQGVQPRQKLQLTIGATAVDGSRFTKGAYDFYTESHSVLEPASALDLTRSDRFIIDWDDPLAGHTRRSTLFVGSVRRLVRLDVVASTLVEGGSLAIVDVAADEPQAA